MKEKLMTKTAMESPNFYLSGGFTESERDSEFDKFMKERFDGGIQNTLLTKNASSRVAQYNFRRIEEIDFNQGNALDFKMLSYPGSLMELVLYDAPDAESGYTLSPDFALDVIQRARQSLGVK